MKLCGRRRPSELGAPTQSVWVDTVAITVGGNTHGNVS